MNGIVSFFVHKVQVQADCQPRLLLDGPILPLPLPPLDPLRLLPPVGTVMLLRPLFLPPLLTGPLRLLPRPTHGTLNLLLPLSARTGHSRLPLHRLLEAVTAAKGLVP
jgi:hypothetical protein